MTESPDAQSTFPDWERWFTLRGLYLDSDDGIHRAHQALAGQVSVEDLGVVWDWVQSKRGLDSPESYFLAQVAKGQAFLQLVAKVRMFQSDGAKPAMRNMALTKQQVHDLRVRDEWIAVHCQERRTVEWVMRREKMMRSEVIAVLVRLCPYFVTEAMYEGPASPWELPDDIVENWRRHDEADVLRAEKVALFTAAATKKVDRRKAQGHPIPGQRNRTGKPVTPEDLTPADINP